MKKSKEEVTEFFCYLCDKHKIQLTFKHDDYMLYNGCYSKKTLVGYELDDTRIICCDCVNERNKDGISSNEGYFLTEQEIENLW